MLCVCVFVYVCLSSNHILLQVVRLFVQCSPLDRNDKVRQPVAAGLPQSSPPHGRSSGTRGQRQRRTPSSSRARTERPRKKRSTNGDWGRRRTRRSVTTSTSNRQPRSSCSLGRSPCKPCEQVVAESSWRGGLAARKSSDEKESQSCARSPTARRRMKPSSSTQGAPKKARRYCGTPSPSL